jgi:hypothetical protein
VHLSCTQRQRGIYQDMVHDDRRHSLAATHDWSTCIEQHAMSRLAGLRLAYALTLVQTRLHLSCTSTGTSDSRASRSPHTGCAAGLCWGSIPCARAHTHQAGQHYLSAESNIGANSKLNTMNAWQEAVAPLTMSTTSLHQLPNLQLRWCHQHCHSASLCSRRVSWVP